MAAYTVVKLIGAGVSAGPQIGNGFTSPDTWESGAPADLTTAEKSAAGTFLTAAFVQGESLTFVGSGAIGKLLETDSTGAGTGTYVVYGITSGNPAASDVVTGGTSTATCVLTSGTPTNVGIVWQGQVNAASDVFTYTGVGPYFAMSGSTPNSTCYKELTTKTGASFRDNSVQSHNLAYNESNGCAVCLTGNGNHLASLMDINEGYSRVNNLQIKVKSTGSTYGAVSAIRINNNNATANPSTVQNCIIEAAKSISGSCVVAGGSGINSVGLWKNCTFVMHDNGAVLSETTSSQNFYNCDIVVVNDAADPANLIAGNNNYTTLNFYACGLFGATAIFTGSGTFTFTSCYSNVSGVTGVTQVTYDQTHPFVDSNDTTLDLRITNGSSLINVYTSPINANELAQDIAGTTKSTSANGADAGAWEYVSAGGVVARVPLRSLLGVGT